MIEALERKLDQLIREPENGMLLNEIGIFLFQQREWELSELYLERAYRLASDNPEIVINYAELLGRLGSTERAIVLYQTYLVGAEDEAVREKLGDCYYYLGQYEAAEKIYSRLHKP